MPEFWFRDKSKPNPLAEREAKMPRFTVEIKEVHNNIFEGIEADDLADALTKANEALEEGKDSVLEYNYTMQPDVWTVKNEDTGDYLQ